MRGDELFVVPSEKHVERLVREGRSAETRAALERRLAAAFLPGIVFVERGARRLALSAALSDPSDDALRGDELLDDLRRKGGRSWAKTIDALDAALGRLYAGGVGASDLAAVAERGGLVAAKAKTLGRAMRALEGRLERFGARDDRRLPEMLARALRDASPEDVEAVVGTKRLRTRWVLSWTPSSLAYFRALDEALSRVGGDARVIVPAFDRPLDMHRERDALEVLADELAAHLDAPLESEIVPPVLGDLGPASLADPSSASVDRSHVRIHRADTPAAQARAAADVVRRALSGGTCVERVAIALPSLDERSLVPLRRALEEAEIVAHETRGAPASGSSVVHTAFDVLDVAESLDRTTVARIVGSGYVDAFRFAPEGTPAREAQASLRRIARRLASTATKSGETAAERLVRTAAPDDAAGARGDAAGSSHSLDRALATALASILSAPAQAKGRVERARAVRASWSALGLGAAAGRGALDTFASDAAPKGIRRAERVAIARDARAWEWLMATLDLYESTASRVGVADAPIDADLFRNELGALLEAAATTPHAGRAGAVRVGRLDDFVGEALDLVLVLDANEGALPRDEARDAFVDLELLGAVEAARAGRRAAKSASSSAFGEHVGASLASSSSPSLATSSLASSRRVRDLASLAAVAAEASSIVFVSTREDASGTSLSPSPIVTALERMGVTPLPVTSTRRPIADESVARRAQREGAREGFFFDPSRPRSDVVGQLELGPEGRALVASTTGGDARPLSVTALERLARCPFMGYAHVVLAVREPSLQGELPDAREEGTLVHAALAAAFAATRALWPQRPRDEASIVELGVRAADATLADGEGHAPLRAVARLRVLDAVRAVLRAAIADETWDFDLAEQPFGSDAAASWPPFVIAAGDERLTLRGTLDRLDRAHDGHDGRAVRVVDYKRSKSKVAQTASALGETVLQVPLYARVARAATGRTATGVYVPFQPRDVHDAKVSAAAQKRMDELVDEPATGLAEIERRALELVVRARRGEFSPVPRSESECVHCAVSGGCRKPRFAMAADEEEEGTA